MKLHPNIRFVELLEGELHRKLRAADDSYCTLCAVLDIERPALKEASKREEQQDAERMADNLMADDLTVDDVLDIRPKIELRCEACGETNQFPMPGIYIGPEHAKDEFLVGGDICCPSCGSLGSFQPSAMGIMALTAELLKLTMAADAGTEYCGPLQFVTASLHDGRLGSPAAAVKEYQRRIKRDPASVPDLLGLGNIYVHVGSLRLAADLFGKCLALEPECVEAAHNLAMIQIDDGNPGSAFQLLDDAWRLRANWRFHRLRECTPQDLTSAVTDLYNTLAAKLPSPSPKLLPVEPGKEDHKTALMAGDAAGRKAPLAATGKVGRKDPCPCASGRKYKKCCGANRDV